MPRWKAALLLGVAMLAFITIPVSGQTASNINLTRLEVDLWPEYDRAEMLVIEHLTLAPGVNFPVNMTLRIPQAVGTPYNLAFRNTDGQLYTISYTKVDNGDWIDIGFSTPTNEIQLEYYDPGLVKQGNNRLYTYTWVGSYPASSVIVQYQQPVGSTNFQVTPAAGSPVAGDGGLMYYTADAGSLKPGQSFTAQVSYQKSGDELSVQSGKVVPSAPISTNTPGRATLNSLWWWLLGLLAVLLIVAGGYWYWRSTHKELAPIRRRHSSTRAVALSAADNIYCHQCGKRASPGDVFCRSCGTRLRREE